METVLIVLVVGFMCLACFIAGAKVGQTVSKGEDIKLPEANPLKAYQEHKDKKKADEESDRLKVIMQNIENYDGTSNGQKDVP